MSGPSSVSPSAVKRLESKPRNCRGPSRMLGGYEAYRKSNKIRLFAAELAIEGQLVTRLASLLWRLRRTVTVDSGLLTIQAGIIRDQRACARPTH